MYTNPTFVPTLETKIVPISLFHQGERLCNIFSEDSEVTPLRQRVIISACDCVQEQPRMGIFLYVYN